jgi:hypothetical protein
MKKRQSIRNILCFIVLAGLIPSCATLHSPHNWLPKVNDVQSEAYGGWITVDYTVRGQSIVSSGELIAVTPEKLLILGEGGLTDIPRLIVNRSLLEIFSENKLSGLAILGTLSTLSHGFYLLLSAPVWIISGTVLAVSESKAGLMRYDGIPPEDIRKYARFPQGLPEGIDPDSLKMKPMAEKKRPEE